MARLEAAHVAARCAENQLVSARQHKRRVSAIFQARRVRRKLNAANGMAAELRQLLDERPEYTEARPKQLAVPSRRYPTGDLGTDDITQIVMFHPRSFLLKKK